MVGIEITGTAERFLARMRRAFFILSFPSALVGLGACGRRGLFSASAGVCVSQKAVFCTITGAASPPPTTTVQLTDFIQRCTYLPLSTSDRILHENNGKPQRAQKLIFLFCKPFLLNNYYWGGCYSHLGLQNNIINIPANGTVDRRKDITHCKKLKMPFGCCLCDTTIYK